MLHVRIDRVPDAVPRGQPGEFEVVVEGECSVSDFCTAITERAAEVLERYGAQQFAELNLAPFPFGLLVALQASG